MVVITKLIMIGIVVVCAVTLAFIILDFVADKVRSTSSKKINRVHFYVARDKDGVLILWFGKPKRAVLSELWYGYDEVNWITDRVDDFHLYNLNPKDFDNLKWEDEPVEVFLNMED